MSSATEVLSLRRGRASSIAGLLAAMEWQCSAGAEHIAMARGHAVTEAADMVLLNVAVHAAEAERMWREGGDHLGTVKRATRSLRRFTGRLRGGQATRQLKFAAFQ